MRSRRVPVLKLGSTGPGGDARSLRLSSQAFAIVRKRPQSFASVRGLSDLCRACVGHENRRETQNCRHFWTCLVSSRLKSVNSHRDRGVVVAKPRTVSSLLDSSRLFASQKCQQSQGSGGSWLRGAELSSLLTSPLKRKRERRKER